MLFLVPLKVKNNTVNAVKSIQNLVVSDTALDFSTRELGSKPHWKLPLQQSLISFVSRSLLASLKTLLHHHRLLQKTFYPLRTTIGSSSGDILA